MAKSAIPDTPAPGRHSDRPSRLYQRVVVSGGRGRYADWLAANDRRALTHPDSNGLVWTSLYEPVV